MPNFIVGVEHHALGDPGEEVVRLGFSSCTLEEALEGAYRMTQNLDKFWAIPLAKEGYTDSFGPSITKKRACIGDILVVSLLSEKWLAKTTRHRVEPTGFKEI